MPQTTEQKQDSAAERAANKRSVRAQLRHLDARGYRAERERAKLQLLLSKHEAERALEKA